MKLCECGCGNSAPIASRTRTYCGHIKGMPIRFINGHRTRIQPKGEKSHAWKGGIIQKKGRHLTYMPEHARANSIGYVPCSFLIIEKAINKIVPITAVIHHHDSNKGNDENTNLVVCENDGYHKLLHQRKRAHDVCGQPHWRKCTLCKQYDKPENLYIYQGNPKGGSIYHRKCKSEKQKRAYKLAVDIIKQAKEL